MGTDDKRKAAPEAKAQTDGYLTGFRLTLSETGQMARLKEIRGLEVPL
ncbi:MAG: hypothetical protein ACOZFS_12290 [Thermodesulfobacteriota bacterium]